jgi:6-phosphogluconate dehydrogenase
MSDPVCDIGLIGLAVMGQNLVLNMNDHGFKVAVFNRTVSKVDDFLANEAKGTQVVGAHSVEELASLLKRPRRVMLMVKAGDTVDQMIDHIVPSLEPGDIIIDGGNSNFHDSQRHSAELAEKKIRFLDAGTSGGIWGLEVGYSLMVGGDESAYKHVEPALLTLAPKDGLGYFGKAGAGHFTKMVHNGIEYAMMQAYAEGFELLKAAEFGIDLRTVTKVWNHGSVVRSWLCELAERAFNRDPELKELKAWVDDSGEGRWTVNEAIAHAVPVPTIAASLFARFSSRQDNSFALRVLSALRNEFGGHAVKKA